MKIESINIKSFGMITDLCLNFSEEINVIIGQNEAGKSTIAAFIKFMLYGFGNEKTPEGVPDERTRYINWDNGTAQGTMVVRVRDKRYLIARVSERVDNGPHPTYKEDSTITDLETGSPAFGKVPAGEIFFGVDKELFENTAFVGQIGDSAINEGSVKQSIENILFSGNERLNNQRAASKVSEKMEMLLHRSGLGGAIYDLKKRRESLIERLRLADEDNRLILAKEAELHTIRAVRREQEVLLDKLTDLDECYRNVVVIQSFDELHSLEVKFEEKNNEYNAFIEANTRNGFVPTSEYLTEIEYTRRQIDEAYRALAKAEEKYNAEKMRIGITAEIEAEIEMCDKEGGEDTVKARAKGKRIRFGVGISLFTIGLVLAIFSVVSEIIATGALAEPLYRALLAMPGVIGLGLAIYGMYSGAKSYIWLQEAFGRFGVEDINELYKKLSVIAEDRRKRDELMRDTEDARISYEASKEAYNNAKTALLDVIVRWGEAPPTSNLNEFLDKLEEKVRAFLDEETRLIDERAELEGKMRELRNVLADKSEIDIRAQVSPLKRKVLTEIDHESIIEGIEGCKVKIAEQEELAKTVEDELAVLKLRATDPGEIYSKLQETDTRIGELELLYRATELALSSIESASDNLRLEISPRLGAYSAQLVGIMTDRKYTDIDVSDGLRVSFVTPLGERRSVDFLSGGTRELTYVALRMALIDMLFTELPPVFFDESFAHQDNSRARAMMRAISTLSRDGMQTFVLSCREREAILARESGSNATIFKLTHGDDDIA